MAKITYPASKRHPKTSLLCLERGDFQRWSKDYLVIWRFKLPDSDTVHEIDDYRVPTVDLKPIVTIGPWTLDKGEDGRMVRERTTEGK